MTKEEFDRYRSGIAYHAVKFQKNEIDKKEMLKALRVSIGEDIFIQTKELIEKLENEE